MGSEEGGKAIRGKTRKGENLPNKSRGDEKHEKQSFV